MRRIKMWTRTMIGTAAAAVVFTGVALATAGSGTTSTLVGPMTRFEPMHAKRESAGWEFELEAKDGLKVATQTITFAPGGQSGWHSHPGAVFIAVKEGTMTFYEDDCTATVKTAGEGFLDMGDHPHLARNETASPATNVVTYFVPPNTTSLRIDEPLPPRCAAFAVDHPNGPGREY